MISCQPKRNQSTQKGYPQKGAPIFGHNSCDIEASDEHRSAHGIEHNEIYRLPMFYGNNLFLGATQF